MCLVFNLTGKFEMSLAMKAVLFCGGSGTGIGAVSRPAVPRNVRTMNTLWDAKLPDMVEGGRAVWRLLSPGGTEGVS